jgi:hypothetical protein
MRSPQAQYAAGIHAEISQAVDCRLSYRVVGQASQIRCLYRRNWPRYRHVGFAAAKCRFELIGLQQPVSVGRRKPEHDFSECQYTVHDIPFLMLS